MLAAVIGGAPRAYAAAEVKVLGHLEVPAKASIMPICTDPVVGDVLSQDLRVQNRGGASLVVTVTVNTKVLSPDVSLEEVSPGDPSIAGMLKDLGAEVPSIGTAAGAAPDPYEEAARKQGTMPDDPLTAQFREYNAIKQSRRSGPATYDGLPENKIYDTAIIAHATISGSASELKVVAVVHPGEDVDTAKRLVAEEIANAILH